MKNGLQFKILLVFGLVLFIVLLNSFISIKNLQKLENSIENIMESNYKSIVSSQSMINSIESQDSIQLAYLFSQSNNFSKEMKSQEVNFLKNLTRAGDNITEKGEKNIVSKIESEYKEYSNLNYKFLNMEKNYSGEFYYTKILPKFEKIKILCKKLQDINQIGMIDKKNKAKNIVENASYLMGFVSLTTIVVGIVFAFYMSKKIIEPLEDLIKKIKEISKGDYGEELKIIGDDEISDLAREFNEMTRKLKFNSIRNIEILTQEKNKAEAIIESISDGILVIDKFFKIELINRAAQNIFDVKEKYVFQQHILELIYNKEIFEMAKNSMKDNEIGFSKKFVDLNIQRGENKLEYCRVYVHSMKTIKGIVGAVILLQNITKLKEIEMVKSEFVSTVSHEFRTPLTSMNMSIELLLKESLGSLNLEQKELLLILKEEEKRLRNLVEDLLDLSKIESGRIELKFMPHRLNELYEIVYNSLKIQLENNKINFKFQDVKNLPKVRIDINKISWVMINLISNAIRYVDHNGKGRIEVLAKKINEKILIEVRDNGIGIEKQYQERIFDKFMRIESENTPATTGTGLGLSISREIIKSHSGEIWVKSVINEGSQFFFTLDSVY